MNNATASESIEI